MTITQFGPIQGKAIAFSICQQRGDRVEEKNAWCAATLDLKKINSGGMPGRKRFG